MQTDRVVPVIRYVGGKRHVGSGYRVAGRFVLTAAHCASGSGHLIRLPDGERGARVVVSGAPAVDLALLEITPGSGQAPVPALPPTPCGRVDRNVPGRISGCVSVGYPRWASLETAPFTTGELDGWIQAASGLADTENGRLEGHLTLMAQGSPPRPLPVSKTSLGRSQWSGMSGAAVFAGRLLIGVVAEHHLPAGDGSLTVVPVEWADRLGGAAREALLGALAAPSAVEMTLVTADEPGARPGGRGDQAALPPDLSLPLGTVPVERAAKDPRSIFPSVGIDAFTGRDWLAREVDRFMAEETCGYVFIGAVAGMGKTAFAAWLVKTRGYLSHFSRYSEGRRTQAALTNLSAQLIRDYGLGDQAPGGMLPAWAQTASGFEELLRIAADRVRAQGQPVVLVVDGLDEAEPVADGLPFGLPVTLPEGVYVVATYRTGLSLVQPAVPARYPRIEENSQENRDDIRAFLDRAVHEVPLSGRIADAGLDPARFARLLAERSGGVWVYLRYVLEELRTGARQPGEAGDLPSGLQDYYADQIRRWQRAPGWTDGLLPLVATLGTAGEALPVATLARLAGDLAPAAVRHWCDFTLRALLTTTRAAPKAPLAYEIYHASFREVIRGDLERPGLAALGEELAEATAAAHHRIAQRYLADFGGLAAGLPRLAADPGLAGTDNGYPLRHLARHLEQAELTSSLHTLLAVEYPVTTDRAVNVWSAAHDHADSLRRYLNDVDRARLDSAHRTDAALGRRPAGSLGQEVRYALVAASIASRTANVPAELLELAFQAGVWSPQRGLDHARRLTDPASRVTALVCIARYCGEAEPGPVLAEALAAVSTADDETQAAALAALAPHLPPELLERALAAARALRSDSGRAAALTGLAPHLPATRQRAVLAQALEAATRVTEDRGRAAALAALAPHLPPDLMATALESAVGISAEGARGTALAALAPHLPAGLLASALDATDLIAEDFPHGWALSQLAPWLPPELLGRALDAAVALPGDYTRRMVLAGLARQLPPALLARALGVADDLSGSARADALADLAPYLPADQQLAVLTRALEAAAGIADDYLRSSALADLAPELPPALLDQALDAVVAIAGDQSRRRALVRMAPQLPPDLLDRALDAAMAHRPRAGTRHDDSFSDDLSRSETLTGFAPHLPAELLDRALEVARALTVDRSRAESLTGLAPHLPPELQQRALDAAVTISNDGWRGRALAGLAPYLPAGLLDQAVQAAMAIAKGSSRAEALTGLAPHLPAPQRPGVLVQALDAATAIADDYWRAEALTRLAPHLPAPQRPGVLVQALDAAVLSSDLLLAGRIAALAPQLPAELLPRALDAAATMTFGTNRASALQALAPRLPPSLMPSALDAAVAITEDVSRAWALRVLAPHLPPALLDQAVDAAAAITTEGGSRQQALTGLAPRLPPALLDRALEAAAAITDGVPRVEALTGLAVHLPAPRQASVLARGLADAASLDGESRAQALASLAPHLPPGLLDQTLDEAIASPDEGTRAQALAGLAPHLPPGLLDRALAAAAALTDLGARAQALTGVASHLAAERRPGVLADALDAAIGADTGYRGWLLARLAPYLPSELLPRAVDAACALTSFGQGAALSGLAPHLTPELAARVLDAAADGTVDLSRGPVLTDLIPRLPPELLPRALEIGVSDQESLADVLTALAPGMPAEWLAWALDRAAGITTPGYRAKLLAGLAPHLPAGLLGRALALAPKDRDEAFTAILERGWSILPGRDWAELLRYSLAAKGRYACLQIIGSAAAVITAAGGAEAACGCADAIADVHRWWP